MADRRANTHARRTARLRLVAVVALLAIAVPGCALITGDSRDPRLLRHRAMSAHPAALLSGTLRSVGPCLAVERGPGDMILVLWPPQYSLGADGDRLAVVDWLGRSRWTVDRPGQIGGGEFGFENLDDFLVGAPVPAQCRFGSYFWLAGP